jgi:hypothetical protein
MTPSICRIHALATAAKLSILVLFFNATAHAQVVFDPKAYRDLSDASSNQSLPIGTKITLHNWTNYRRFIPVGFQIAQGGKYAMKIADGADYIIEVGPSRHFGLPKKFLEDTEKYRGREHLVPSEAGGYTLSPMPGSLAGLPFGTDPTEPNLGYKVLYNWWLAPAPAITHYTDYDWYIDRYQSVTRMTSDATLFRLSHLSEPGSPEEMPYSQGYLKSERYEMVAPEQMKYTTSLQLWTQDPVKYSESYAFVPSQRHSFRLSTVARCKPLPGTDYIEDDFGFQLANFKVSYLGLKRVLTRIQDSAKAFDPSSYYVTASFPGWPKAGTGTWELRDHYVIDVQALPVMGKYCYSHRVIYVDKETWVADLHEMYDADGRFWKLFWFVFAPIRYDGAETLMYPTGRGASEMLDFKTNHASLHRQQNVTFGEQVPPRYQNAEQLSLPAGLQQVLR